MKKLDISGSKGNAFYVLSVAENLSNQLEYNTEEILSKLKSGSYNHLLKEFNHWFDDVVHLVSPEVLPGVDPELYSIDEPLAEYL